MHRLCVLRATIGMGFHIHCFPHKIIIIFFEREIKFIRVGNAVEQWASSRENRPVSPIKFFQEPNGLGKIHARVRVTELLYALQVSYLV